MKWMPFAVVAAVSALTSAQASTPNDIMRRIQNPDGGLIVVAHRGCHEPAPYHGLGAAPENSVTALRHCIEMGVDVMETDVHKSRDGYLVMIHDDTVDRTTDGHGEVSQLSLAQLKALRLRQNEGGAKAPVTTDTMLTLDEILALAKGHIVLNLDVKDMIYGEVVDAVERAHAQEWVIVKTYGGEGSVPLASIPPYNRVPFMVITASADGLGADIPDVITKQMAGPTKPIGFEMPYIPHAALPPIADRAKAVGKRLWANTLDSGFIVGAGGDIDALRNPDAVWGQLYREGISMMQTDDPEAMLRFRDANSYMRGPAAK